MFLVFYENYKEESNVLFLIIIRCFAINTNFEENFESAQFYFKKTNNNERIY